MEYADKNLSEGSKWNLLMPADDERQGNVFIKIGNRLIVNSNDVIGVTNRNTLKKLK